MTKKKKLGGLVGIVAWIVGILVSLAVGFGMISGTLTIPYIQIIVPIAGWIVVVLTIISVILVIADKI